MNRNCLSYWFPLLEEAGVPTPKTEIIHIADSGVTNLRMILDGKEPPGYVEFITELKAAAARIGLPCFLRTGQTSGKHFWLDTCFLTDLNKISDHVAQLVEFSECADFIGLPWNVWVVRELIHTETLFTAFKGFPVVREFRAFVDGGTMQCIHPYWPPDAFERRGPADVDWRPDEFEGPKPADYDWQDKLSKANELPPHSDDGAAVKRLAEQAGAALPGVWSIDLLQDSSGKWWVTDCADAGCSYHYRGCINDGRWERQE